MSIARNLASLFSASTSAATDSEVTAAIATHNTSANGHVKRGGTASRPNSPSNGDLYYNTDLDTLESYDGTSWFSANAIPLSPSSVVATNQPSGRAFNNGQASIAFTPNSRSGKTTSYTVTSSPGGYTASASSSPIVITGLQSSTQYTYTVAANGPFGTSVASSASSGVTATTVPEAPTIGTPSASGNAYSTTTSSLSVPVTANATGGSAITSYTVTSNPGSFTASGASGPLSVSGLSVGTAYTFTATATNENGTSLNSSTSASTTVTTVPQAPTIGTATDNGSQGATVTFTPGATGGSAITTYTATSSPDGITGTSASSPITVSNLTIGTAYTFTVTATNANGISEASAASNAVTAALPSFDSIASITYAANVGPFTFNNIPQTYKHLLLVQYSKAGAGATNDIFEINIRYNNVSTTSYNQLGGIYFNGSASGANYGSNSQNTGILNDGMTGSSNPVFASSYYYIMNYSDSAKKPNALYMAGTATGNTVNQQSMVSAATHLNSAQAVSRIDLTFLRAPTTSYGATLFGIKG
jgi:hypothetical protein